MDRDRVTGNIDIICCDYDNAHQQRCQPVPHYIFCWPYLINLLNQYYPEGRTGYILNFECFVLSRANVGLIISNVGYDISNITDKLPLDHNELLPYTSST